MVAATRSPSAACANMHIVRLCRALNPQHDPGLAHDKDAPPTHPCIASTGRPSTARQPAVTCICQVSVVATQALRHTTYATSHLLSRQHALMHQR